MAFKMFGWVPDGTYDHQDFLVRYTIVAGNPRKVIGKAWLDAGGPADVDSALKIKWGSYPNMPPKPPK